MTWRSNDLVSSSRLFLRNRHVLDRMEEGAARLTRPLQKLMHRINRNTRAGARRNISADYDLGNGFFGLWLDGSMSLAEARCHRLEVICAKLELGPRDHLLEIGTGWGGLAMHAAKTSRLPRDRDHDLRAAVCARTGAVSRSRPR